MDRLNRNLNDMDKDNINELSVIDLEKCCARLKPILNHLLEIRVSIKECHLKIISQYTVLLAAYRDRIKLENENADGNQKSEEISAEIDAMIKNYTDKRQETVKRIYTNKNF